MMTLFDSVFLHEGHIGSCSPFFAAFESSASLDADRDWPEEEKNENLTGIRFFSLIFKKKEVQLSRWVQRRCPIYASG
jgi:hypothetical protein